MFLVFFGRRRNQRENIREILMSYDTWLLIDVSQLAYRAFYALGGLEFEGEPTTVVYGFLKDIVNLQDLHATDKVAFCFDVGKSDRKKLYNKYKESRWKEDDPEKLQALWDLKKQINKLRKEYLPELGYNNVFSQKGYEADDIIASICLNTLPDIDTAIIISNDSDLYQLLSNRVSMWNVRKNKMTTYQSFSKEWSLSPSQWSDVKAIGGCSSDNVKGVKGIGEKTAAKYLRGELKPESKAYEKIIEWDRIWKRNIALVELPFQGTNEFQLKKDEVTKEKWMRLADRLGMKSLRKKAPISARAGRRRGLLK